MKVLFCADGSKLSYDAILNFSKFFDNFSVDILSVSDFSCFPDTLVFENSRLVNECVKSASDILDFAYDYLQSHNMKVGTKIKLCGAAIDSIIDVEKSGAYDYIILGSNGKKGIQKWLGSVSQEVASSSITSVYISKMTNSSKNVLFTVEDYELLYPVLRNSLNNMNLSDKNIYLLSVYQMPDYLFLEGNVDSNWISDVDIQLHRNTEFTLAQTEKLFNEFGLSVKSKSVLKGNPSKLILSYSLSNNIDLIVTRMGNQKKRVFESVSKRVLENSIADMLIIKDNEPYQ